MALSAKTTAILKKKSKGDMGLKAVLIKIPNEQFTEVMKKQSRMISEAADLGQTSNVSLNSVVLAALKAFCVE
jgi:hypothetical protein